MKCCLVVSLIFLAHLCMAQDTDTLLANGQYKIADSLIRINRLDSSMFYFQKAAVIYKKAGMTGKYASCRNKITENLWRKGKYKEATKEAQAVLEIAKALGPGNTEEAFAYENLGIINDDNGRYAEAYRYYMKTAAIKRSLYGEFHFELANTYNNLGIFFGNKGDYDSAIVYQQKSLAIKRKLYGDGDKSVANSLNNIGIVYLHKSDFRQSLSYYQQALALRLKLLGPDHLDVGTSYNNIGMINARLGDYKNALEYYQQAVVIKEKLLGTENQEMGSLYTNMAVLYFQLGDYETAKLYDEKALHAFNKVHGENSLRSAMIYTHIGAMSISEGNYEMGLEYHRNVLNIQKAARGERHASVASAYNNIGVAHLHKKEFEKALEYFEKAMAIQISLFDKKNAELGETYNNMGLVYLENGDQRLALDYFNRSLSVKRLAYGDTHPMIAAAIKSLGDLYYKGRNPAKALVQYEKALKIYRSVYQKKHPAVADLYNSMGQSLLEKGDYAGALAACEQALSENGVAILNKAWLLKSLDLKATICQRLYEQSGDESQLLRADTALQTGGKLADNIRNSQLKNEDKITLAETSSSLYKKAVQVYTELFWLKKDTAFLQTAFYFSGKAKASVLSQAIADLSARNIGSVPANLLSLEKELKLYKAFYEEQIIRETTEKEKPDPENIALYETRLFDANRRYDSLIRSFEKQFPGYYRLKYRDVTADIRLLQDRLPTDKTAIVEYLLTNKEVYAFIITKKGLTYTRTVITVPLDSLLTALRSYNNSGLLQQSADKTYSQFTETAAQLYRQLFEPVQSLLGNEVRSLVIVPDGILSLIPFEILISGGHNMQNGSYKELPYLLKKYSISYAYSASLWNTYVGADYAGRRWESRFMGFAPAYSSGYLAQSRELQPYDQFMSTISNLAFTGAEVNSARQFFPGSIFSGEGATETAFKNNAGHSAILHLAMHAIIDEKNPMLSKLIFSQADSMNDGFLNAYELYHLAIPAEMVVLSACKTGYGKLAHGEGVMSLSRAFSYAGCGSMIMSLWQADDKATSEVIKLFYKHLATGMNKDEALRTAKLEFLAQADPLTAHPYFWGAFIANGDMQPVQTTQKGWMNNYKWWILTAGILLVWIAAYTIMRRKQL